MNINDDQKSFVKDTINSAGWQIIKKMGMDGVANVRKMATQQEVKLEDRLWFSALAQGVEDFLADIERL